MYGIGMIQADNFELGGGVGLLSAAAKVYARRHHLIKSVFLRIHATTFINQTVREVAICGNNIAAIGLLYFFIGRTASYIFEEELAYVPKVVQISLCGALTGALCKCLRGRQAALFAAGIGLFAAPALHYFLGKTNANISI